MNERGATTLRPRGQNPLLRSDSVWKEPLVRGGAASGNRTPDLLITRRPYHAYYGVYLRQQLQFSHVWVH